MLQISKTCCSYTANKILSQGDDYAMQLDPSLKIDRIMDIVTHYPSATSLMEYKNNFYVTSLSKRRKKELVEKLDMINILE